MGFYRILSKFRTAQIFHIVLQQNNAGSNVSNNDAVVTEQGQKENWKLLLASRLPNLPDYNL